MDEDVITGAIMVRGVTGKKMPHRLWGKLLMGGQALLARRIASSARSLSFNASTTAASITRSCSSN